MNVQLSGNIFHQLRKTFCKTHCITNIAEVQEDATITEALSSCGQSDPQILLQEQHPMQPSVSEPPCSQPFHIIGKESPRFLIVQHNTVPTSSIILCDLNDGGNYRILHKILSPNGKRIQCCSVDLDVGILALVTLTSSDTGREYHLEVIHLWEISSNNEELNMEKGDARVLHRETFAYLIQPQLVRHENDCCPLQQCDYSKMESSSSRTPSPHSVHSSTALHKYFRTSLHAPAAFVKQSITFHLLLFHHGDKVTLRHMQLLLTTDKIALNPTFQEEEICQGVCWLQWEPCSRRLFCLSRKDSASVASHPLPETSPHHIRANSSWSSTSSSTNYRSRHSMQIHLFQALQLHFINNVAHVVSVFHADIHDLQLHGSNDVSIPSTEEEEEYFHVDHTFGNCSYFTGLVLTHVNGCIAFCVQTPAPGLGTSTKTSFKPGIGGVASLLAHRIYFFNNEKIVTCCLTPPISEECSRITSRGTCFYMLQNYLVCTNQLFSHFINIDTNSRERLSFLIENGPLFSKSGFHGKVVNLQPSQSFPSLWNTETGDLWTVAFDCTRCYRQFCITKSFSNQQALFNAILVNNREMDVVRDAFHYILTSKLAMRSMQPLIEEFLTTSVHQLFNKNYSRQQHFLCSTTLAEKVQEQISLSPTSSGDNVEVTNATSQHVSTFIQFMPEHSVHIMLDVNYKRCPSHNHWINLVENYANSRSQRDIKCFTLNYTPKQSAEQLRTISQRSDETTAGYETTSDQESTFFQVFFESFSFSRMKKGPTATSMQQPPEPYQTYRPPSRTTGAMFSALPFYLREPLFSREQSSLVENKFIDYLSQREVSHLHLQQKRRMADVLAASVMMQVRMLYHIVHYILAPPCLKVSEVDTESSLDLFLLINSIQDRDFYMTLHNLRLVLLRHGYPIPAAVETVYTCTAFHVLKPVQFHKHFKEGCYASMNAKMVQHFVKHVSSNTTGLKDDLLELLPWDDRFSLIDCLDDAQKLKLLSDYTTFLMNSGMNRSTPGDGMHMTGSSFGNRRIDNSGGPSGVNMMEDVEGRANPLNTFLAYMKKLESHAGLPSKAHILEKVYKGVLLKAGTK